MPRLATIGSKKISQIDQTLMVSAPSSEKIAIPDTPRIEDSTTLRGSWCSAHPGLVNGQVARQGSTVLRPLHAVSTVLCYLPHSVAVCTQEPPTCPWQHKGGGLGKLDTLLERHASTSRPGPSAARGAGGAASVSSGARTSRGRLRRQIKGVLDY